MDWSNERYVRLYTRDTDDWLALTWQGRALFPLMLRKVDRAGVLETRRGMKGVTALVNLPREIVEVGLPDLIEDGCVVPIDRGYLLPNFIDAQEAAQTDAQRARESRQRRRDTAKQEVTNRDAKSRTVTEASHGVTPRHSSQPTPSEPSNPTHPTTAVENWTPPDPDAYRRALVVAANGAVNVRWGEQAHPILPQHRSSGELARDLLEAAIPLPFAQASIARQVAETAQEIPRHLGYFRRGIFADWEAHHARQDAAGSAPVKPLGKAPSYLESELARLRA